MNPYSFVSKDSYLRTGRRFEDLNDHDKEVMRVRGLKVHKPISDVYRRANVFTTECGKELKHVIFTEDGIEAVTCYRCQKISDGI